MSGGLGRGRFKLLTGISRMQAVRRPIAERALDGDRDDARNLLLGFGAGGVIAAGENRRCAEVGRQPHSKADLAQRFAVTAHLRDRPSTHRVRQDRTRGSGRPVIANEQHRVDATLDPGEHPMTPRRPLDQPTPARQLVGHEVAKTGMRIADDHAGVRLSSKQPAHYRARFVGHVPPVALVLRLSRRNVLWIDNPRDALQSTETRNRIHAILPSHRRTGHRIDRRRAATRRLLLCVLESSRFGRLLCDELTCSCEPVSLARSRRWWQTTPRA